MRTASSFSASIIEHLAFFRTILLSIALDESRTLLLAIIVARAVHLAVLRLLIHTTTDCNVLSRSVDEVAVESAVRWEFLLGQSNISAVITAVYIGSQKSIAALPS